MCSKTTTDADMVNENATPAKRVEPTKPSKIASKRRQKSHDKLYCICAQKAYGRMIACDNEVSSSSFDFDYSD
jgi:hypothetical protein